MIRSRNSHRLLILAYGLAMVFLLALPVSAMADDPGSEDAATDTCTKCHWSETSQWQQSPHAAEGVACETCHGAYVEGHPDEGVMTLSVDPVMCQGCHEDTTHQWQQSLHADENVNCINCHVSHSQTTRVQSEQLCCSCHSDGFGEGCGMTTHKVAGVSCVDCHVSDPMIGLIGEDSGGGGHTFTAVPGQLCMNCHGDGLHEPTALPLMQPASKAQLLALANESTTLSEQVDETSKLNDNLQIVALVLLGVGMGVGILIGLVLMLIFGYINQKGEVS